MEGLLQIASSVGIELEQRLVVDGQNDLVTSNLCRFDVKDGSMDLSLKDTPQWIDHLEAFLVEVKARVEDLAILCTEEDLYETIGILRVHILKINGLESLWLRSR